jgi:hypothetical protein
MEKEIYAEIKQDVQALKKGTQSILKQEIKDPKKTSN